MSLNPLSQPQHQKTLCKNNRHPYLSIPIYVRFPPCGYCLKASMTAAPNPIAIRTHPSKPASTIIHRVPHRHSRVGGKPQGGRARHAGFKAVSTGRQGPSCWLQGSIHRAAGAVMLASRQYPQGGVPVVALKDMKTPCLYIITNKTHGTLYVGVTSDLIQRIWQHKNGLIEGFSKRYGLKMLVWFEQHDSMESAIVRERNVKYWRRDWKIQLIEESNPTWRDLYSDIL